MPAKFEWMMEKMLVGMIRKQCIVYLDDVIVFGRTEKLALKHLQLVLVCLRDYGLNLKPEKCKLFRQQAEYLRCIVSPSATVLGYCEVLLCVHGELCRSH